MGIKDLRTALLLASKWMMPPEDTPDRIAEYEQDLITINEALDDV